MIPSSTLFLGGGEFPGDYYTDGGYTVLAPCSHGSCCPDAGDRQRGGLYNRERDDRRRDRSLPGHRLPLHQLSGLEAPSLEEFDALAADAHARLPKAFHDLTSNVIIRVQEFPDDDVLTEMKAETEFDLLGLFQGTGLAHGEELAYTGQLPNMVFLYRRPILDYWAEHRETLGAIIAHVLVHEIGHHFGLSDADMERIEKEAS